MTHDKAELTPPLPAMGFSNDEVTTLVEMLDYYRAVLARKGSGLTQEQLAMTVGTSDLSVGGLIYHMAWMRTPRRRVVTRYFGTYGPDMMSPMTVARRPHRWRWLAAAVLTVATLLFASRLLTVLFRALGGVVMPLAISAAVVAALAWLIGAKLAGGKVLAGVAVGVFLAPFVLILLTLPRNAAPKPTPVGHELEYWELATGRQIGFIEITPAEPNDQPPVVVLHGGPGGGTTDVDVIWGEEFAAAGYTTYVYDQAGVGWSPRTDPSAYTVAASVADLEAIRQAVGADQIILAGHSWGGTLAAHYATSHQDHVAALLLSAPGPFSGPSVARIGPNLTASTATTSIHFRRPLPLGVRLVDALSARGLPAVQQLITQDVEAAIVQDWLDPSTALARGVCAGEGPGPVPDLMRNSNLNITAHGLIGRDLQTIDPGDTLTALTVPTLIVRGVCDFVPWTAHRHYRDTIPGAQLVVVEGVGHRARVIEPMLNFLATGDSGWVEYLGSEFPLDDGS